MTNAGHHKTKQNKTKQKTKQTKQKELKDRCEEEKDYVDDGKYHGYSNQNDALTNMTQDECK